MQNGWQALYLKSPGFSDEQTAFDMEDSSAARWCPRRRAGPRCSQGENPHHTGRNGSFDCVPSNSPSASSWAPNFPREKRKTPSAVRPSRSSRPWPSLQSTFNALKYSLSCPPRPASPCPAGRCRRPTPHRSDHHLQEHVLTLPSTRRESLSRHPALDITKRTVGTK